MSSFERRLGLLDQPATRPLLRQVVRGIEKESLRVDAAGNLSQRPHPRALGSALTHPSITTDFSEALLEFITPPSTSVTETLATLEQIHRFAYQVLEDELIWVNSMPCVLGEDTDIPVARYGSSNVGRMKTIYRIGLGNRYGRLMQTIAGIHYNWSLPDSCWEVLRADDGRGQSLQEYKTARYFGLIRNFRRYFWLLLYLFGAAPAVCRSFVRGRQHSLVPFGEDTHSLYAPHGTSLRMGNLGYQSSAQQQLNICYNSLESYVSHLRKGLTTPYPPYAALGLKDADGGYRQLSESLLQIENEFYSTIRPKRSTDKGEVPLRALGQHGVEYIEVRCIDLNPYAPVGIDAGQIRFLDTFLLFCLLAESPPTNPDEHKLLQFNQHQVVYLGREPNLKLEILGREHTLTDWARELFTAMTPVAALFDDAYGSDDHGAALRSLAPRIQDSSLTPAARLLAEMGATGQSYFQTALRQAREHRDRFRAAPPDPATLARYQAMATQSLTDQATLEAADKVDFAQFLATYYAQYDFGANS
jgi:glutamate--cysteine ligase